MQRTRDQEIAGSGADFDHAQCTAPEFGVSFDTSPNWTERPFRNGGPVRTVKSLYLLRHHERMPVATRQHLVRDSVSHEMARLAIHMQLLLAAVADIR